MSKIIQMLVGFFIIIQNLYSQNLVINGSFEDYKYCPGELMPKELFSPDGWEKITGMSTPDYYNSCAIDINYSVPINHMGNISAYKGNGYIGIIPFNLEGYMEHVVGKLDTTLIKGKTYNISFYYLIPNYRVRYFSSKLEVYISDVKPRLGVLPYYNTNDMGQFKAQITNPETNILKDSAWTKFEGKYIAIGGEKYITIGIFYDNSSDLANEIDEVEKYFMKKGKTKDIKYYQKWAVKNEGFIKSKDFGEEDYPYYLIDNVCVELIKEGYVPE